MINNTKIIVVTPSGRESCLRILKNYIVKARCVDEWHLWVNTDVQSDLDYMDKLAKEYDFIQLKRVNPDHPMTRDWRQWNLHLFYEYCQEDAVYLRIDDDIVWMDTNAIEQLAIERINNTGSFIVYPNILNNCLMSHLQYRLGNYPKEWGIAPYETYNEISLKSPEFFINLHTQLLEDIKNDKMDIYKFNKWVLLEWEHHSVTVSAMRGDHAKARNGKMEANDEIEMNINIPKELGEFNEVVGWPLFIHYQYFYQKEGLKELGKDEDMFLEDYFNLSNNI